MILTVSIVALKKQESFHIAKIRNGKHKFFNNCNVLHQLQSSIFYFLINIQKEKMIFYITIDCNYFFLLYTLLVMLIYILIHICMGGLYS